MNKQTDACDTESRVKPAGELRLAMLGMIEGNGHPYSWSAIFNGYRPEEMVKCPYPVIADYLGHEDRATMGIPGARVTHIWTDRPQDAEAVARASCIEQVVSRPEDVLGQVDAVIIATDDGSDHVRRCRPFIEAGLPIFVDKPLADNQADLKQFSEWVDAGARVLSSSSMRYCKEFKPYHQMGCHEIGQLRYVGIATPKAWERYGIHALESIYPIVGPGFLTVRNIGDYDRNIVHLTHRCGADIVITAIKDLYGAFCPLQLYGTAGRIETSSKDTYYSFRAQLLAFVDYVRSGKRPFPFAETREMMEIIIAGSQSRALDGRLIRLAGA